MAARVETILIQKGSLICLSGENEANPDSGGLVTFLLATPQQVTEATRDAEY